MYNSGYWINKVTSFHINGWRWTRKHNRPVGLYGMLLGGTFLFAIVYYVNQLAQTNNISFGEVLITEFMFAPMIIGGFIFLISLALFAQKPIQVEQKTFPTIRKEKRKKLPKRRKDYK